MQRVRYTGDDAARDIALPGGVIFAKRMVWVDLEKAAVAAGIPVHHVAIVQEGLLTSADWEREGPAKAARTRKQNASIAEEPPAPDEPTNPDEPTTTEPAEPDEEQDR